MTDKEDPVEHNLELSGSITDKEKELGSDCYSTFKKKNYDRTIQLLKELAANRSNDPKIQHNVGVAEFYSSKFRHVEKLERVLQNVRKIYQLDTNNGDRLDDVAHCVLFFNQAVISYHLHKYQTAIDLINKVFDFIEPLDSDFRRRIIFLFIELCLCISEPNRALSLINYADKILFQSNDSKKVESKTSNWSSPDESDSLIFKPKLLQYRIRSYLMLKSTKACKREIKNLSSSGFQSEAVLLKGNMEYIRGNYKKAGRVLNSAQQPNTPKSQSGENELVYHFNNKGCLSLYLGKPSESCAYFRAAMRENKSGLEKLFETSNKGSSKRNAPLPAVNGNVQYKLCYNLGIAYLYAENPAIAFELLTTAVKVYKSNPRLWLRIAECCIKIYKKTNEVDFKKPEKEVNFVKKIVGSGAHRKVVLTSNVRHENKPSIEVNKSHKSQSPTLQYAAICLKTALFFTNSPFPQSGNNYTSGQKTEQTEDQEKPPQANAASGLDNSGQFIRVQPCDLINMAEVASLRTSILTASSYVHLALENPVLALHYAEEIMKQPKLSSMHRYLANMYAADALIKLDRLSEGIDFLSWDRLGPDFDITTEGIDDKDDKENIENNAENNNSSCIPCMKHLKDTGWFPKTTETAQNAMQYNLTVAHTLRGELDKANNQLERMVETAAESGSEIPAQTPVLSTYIELQSGCAHLTRSLIAKEYLLCQ